MPPERLILCGQAKLTSSGKVWRKAKTLHLHTGVKRGNVTVRISDITDRMVKNLPAVAADLLEIAAYVYCADQQFTRGGTKNFNYGKNWRRHFRFEIPVRRPDVWSDKQIVEELTRTLGFLSDDDYEFSFSKAVDPLSFNEYLEYDKSTRETSGVDEVLLFSGGLDSFGGAVEEVLQQRRKVALVSHRAASKLIPKQLELVEKLRQRVGDPRLSPLHVPVLITKDSALSQEYTQRGRSFLYASIAAVVARLFELDRIRFYENGVVSMNLPICAQVIGARATRTTHPRVLDGFESLFSLLFERNFRVENPFLWKTRTDVATDIKVAGHAELCRYTFSCVHTIAMTKRHSHCGVCSQCIDRRLATLAAGYSSEHDPKDRYKNDVLTGARETTENRTMIERVVGTATEIERMDDALQFCTRFGEVGRLIDYIDGDADGIADRVFKLYKRHAEQICGVIDAAGSEHVSAMRRKSLPPTCLISIVLAGCAKEKEGKTKLCAGDAYEFRHDGDGWHICFDGASGHYKALDGFAYIHALLKRRQEMGADCGPIDGLEMIRNLKPPEVPLNASRSVSRSHSTAPDKTRRRQGGEYMDDTVDQAALAAIDRAIQETTENVADTLKEIEAAHRLGSEAEAERLTRDELDPERKKLERLEQNKRQSLGLHGRRRRLTTADRDKARQTVRQAIRVAYRRLQSGNTPMTALVDHLRRSIPPASGGSFIYSPDSLIGWRLD